MASARGLRKGELTEVNIRYFPKNKRHWEHSTTADIIGDNTYARSVERQL